MNFLPNTTLFKGAGKRVLLLFSAALVGAGPLAFTKVATATACTPPSSDYGAVTSSFNVASSASYKIWSRIMAPDTTNNSYLLEVDSNTCYKVGDAAITPNTWTWVDYQNGSTSSKITQSLSAGTHSSKLIGNEPGVKVDRVLFVSDQTCVPTGLGDNCSNTADITPPSVSMTSPADGATVSGTVNIAATASDNSSGTGVSKVEFYVDGSLKNSDSSTPYSFGWDSGSVPNGSHTLLVKAYDGANNTASDSAQVTTKNGDTTAPSAPLSVSATANAYNKVTVTWKASTDNVGVSGYYITRNNVTLAKLGAVTSYTDVAVSASTKYNYQLTAFDAAGNMSATSNVASVTTPAPPFKDTQAPTTPGNVSAEVVNASQINLDWDASTDNVGVTGYDIYRTAGSGSPSKIATALNTSFGDSGLSASTQYAYYVVAHDAAGNASSKSNTTTATTTTPLPKPPVGTGDIEGIVTNQRNHHPIVGARVTLYLNNMRRLITTNQHGEYTIDNVPAGFYAIRYSAANYYSHIQTVKVKSDRVKTIDVTLWARR